MALRSGGMAQEQSAVSKASDFIQSFLQLFLAAFATGRRKGEYHSVASLSLRISGFRLRAYKKGLHYPGTG
jgi:hypothetical protein